MTEIRRRTTAQPRTQPSQSASTQTRPRATLATGGTKDAAAPKDAATGARQLAGTKSSTSFERTDDARELRARLAQARGAIDARRADEAAARFIEPPDDDPSPGSGKVQRPKAMPFGAHPWEKKYGSFEEGLRRYNTKALDRTFPESGVFVKEFNDDDRWTVDWTARRIGPDKIQIEYEDGSRKVISGEDWARGNLEDIPVKRYTVEYAGMTYEVILFADGNIWDVTDDENYFKPPPPPASSIERRPRD